jgi:hypothetical protein
MDLHGSDRLTLMQHASTRPQGMDRTCTTSPLRVKLLSGLVAAVMLVATSAHADDAGALPSFSSRATAVIPVRPPELPTDAELVSAGARVGRVRIDAKEVFDTTRPDENTSLFRFANRIHVRTRDSTIATLLLFRSGETFDPRLLAESERLLRDTRYLFDARIIPVAYHEGLVDVDVVTYDVWTLNPGVSFGRQGGANTSGISVEELNFLGLGSQLSFEQLSGIDRDSTRFQYRDRQLGASWWRIALDYSDNSDGSEQGVVLDHDFYALDARWAGGVTWRDDDRAEPRYDLGEKVGEFRRQRQAVTAYGGWSRGLVDGHVLRWTAGFTLDDRRFAPVRGTGLPTPTPPDRKLAYPWIAAEWLQDDFRRERNRDQIERTEDFLYGWRARAQLGFAEGAFGADRSAVIFDTRVSRGIEPSRNQTWLLSGSLAGRYEDGALADTVLSGQSRWYLRQSDRRLLYAALGFEAGHNLDADRQILLGGDSGLRGYPLRYQGGEGRWLFTLEQRAFTNWYPFRLVNVGAAAFVDVGGTWGDNPFGTRSRGVLTDVGIGLRLGNSRSALGNVLHIDLAFPLNGDQSIDSLQVLVETKRSF